MKTHVIVNFRRIDQLNQIQFFRVLIEFGNPLEIGLLAFVWTVSRLGSWYGPTGPRRWAVKAPAALKSTMKLGQISAPP